MRKKWSLFIMSVVILLGGCDYSHKEDQHGFFYTIFVKPMDMLLHFLGRTFHENYGLAIIVIVLIIRLVLMPLMFIQVKNIHIMRGKTQVVKPEIEKLQDKLKNADTQEERTAANKLLMKKYNDYGINPFKSLVGTLPILIQIPILLGLYACIKYPTSGGIIEHPHFLWFNLMHTDLIMTFIAALLYLIQPMVNAMHYPKEERRTYYVMMVLSPLFIIYASLQSASALSLYWAISATFLIIQMHFAHSHYAKVGKAAGDQLRKQIDEQRRSKSTNHND
ncbi:membrane protein insertase YidC [Listeria monocytogenes]|uniref:membrane protein insertase YidC n=1 Tax=Staphylococcus haemolyticus TaxID=1283 RepID=UPI0015D6C3AA|nr:membrane protein insertase YidC [Staphylococcus haemolyticus]ECO1693620.1 membrane protein insertase YidC [Listeria monocytogenes]MCH4382341.1 membrane protein insertase YidC [Staphylococcus haemolyticus]MCH4389166.1 membrane protein insertase YidC [Staphylococcus haemolyticus]MCH4403415.1 membrane protein insertase YidC [Staphylococcus haemolyticus]MCH4518599.1 membrane protein insertase YidC [Staphylococcus haemolyticus]